MKRMKALLVAFYLVVTMVLLSLVANAGLAVGDLFSDERQIIADGCLINYYRNN